MIKKTPEKLTDKNYDLIIIGAGIYGVMLSMEASLRGLTSLLLEKDDFGSATSYNSLRILHGGLRYLQNLDLRRFFESVNERRWFFQKFPGLVEPLPCIMPLYNRGLHRKSVFRLALLLNDILSYKRNQNVDERFKLKSSKVVSSNQTIEKFPLVDRKKLKGAAFWYDGSMPDSQRILIEILKWACLNSADALNYFEAKQLLKANNAVKGVVALDRESGLIYNFKSNVVVNSAGPWCREVAKSFDKDYPELFKTSIAWNLLFNKNNISEFAVAVTPDKPNAKTYFLRPWKGMLLAGTIHETWDKIEKNPIPSMQSIQVFIEDLNQTIPGLNLNVNDVVKIFSGLLPAKKEGTDALAVREVLINHNSSGGPEGLYSVSGVKFTTSRLVAEKVLNEIYPSRKIEVDFPVFNIANNKEDHGIFSYREKDIVSKYKDSLLKIIKDESVIHLDDLIYRRTTLGDNPLRALEMVETLCSLFDWDEEKQKSELERFSQLLFSEKKHISEESINV